VVTCAQVPPALARASTTSLGSICLGSLVVAMIEGLRSSCQFLRRCGVIGWCGTCFAQAVLSCIDAVWRYANRWGYVYVSRPFVEGPLHVGD
jgi:hypothetical protein